MRAFVFAVFTAVFALALSGFAVATREVVAPHVRVLYDTEAEAAYAQRVAAEAEHALELLTPLFGAPKRPITLNLRADTDVFNAFANPVPRPQLGVRTLFPLGGEVGFRAADPLLLVLLHELTHLGQLTYTDLPDGVAPRPQFGLVGENVARVPPTWFVEGVAVWVESRYAEGGRLNDATTKVVLETLALSDTWPSLTDAGLGAYDAWPGGLTRYLVGAGFVDFLVQRHSFDAVLATLRAYNAGGFLGTFSAAWHKAVGTSLADEWEMWRQEVEASAQARADTLKEKREDETVLTETGWYTGSPAVSPDGTRLAWVTWPPGVNVADIAADGGLADFSTVLRDRRPETLRWLDSHTLLYNRTVRQAGSQLLELFTFDLETRQETQLTAGARAHFPGVDPAGCVLYVRDDGAVSSLVSWCEGVTTPRWTAPPGAHVTGLAVSPGGQVALGLWQAGFADLALLDGDELTYLTRDAAQDVDPAWQGEDALLFGSDRDEAGVFEVYRLELGSLNLSQQTRTLGGALEPVPLGEQFLYARLSAKGYDLALGKLEPTTRAPALTKETPPEADESQQTFEVRAYSPWSSLVPYGWLPLAISPALDVSALSVAATVLGQDDSGEHGYAFTLGYAGALAGPLGGFHADLSYSYRANSVLNGLLPPYPLGFGVRLGTWPHTPHLLPVTEIATGVQASLDLTLPFDRWTLRGRLAGGPLYLRSYGAWQADAALSVALSNQRTDDWGYRRRGFGFGVKSVLSATPTGPSFGLWADGSAHLPLNLLGVTGTGDLGVRAGYRQTPPVPLFLQPWAGVATAGYRVSLPTPLRYGDGLYALERVTLEPRVRGWFDGGFGLGGFDLGGFGVGGDLSVNADLLLNYAAPVSFGVTVGYAQGFWYRLGARVGL